MRTRFRVLVVVAVVTIQLLVISALAAWAPPIRGGGLQHGLQQGVRATATFVVKHFPTPNPKRYIVGGRLLGF